MHIIPYISFIYYSFYRFSGKDYFQLKGTTQFYNGVLNWDSHLVESTRKPLNPRRHSPFRHPSRHKGGCDPPRDWFLSELELRLKKQRVACHETKPLTPSLRSWVDRWPLKSGQWPKNGQNATSTITSHLSKLEPRFKDQNVPYGLRNTMRCLLDPHGPFWGSKFKE